MANLLKQLGAAMMGQMLPDASVLSEILQEVKKGMAASIAAAVLLSTAFLVLAFVLYEYLLLQGLTTIFAASVMAGFLALLSFICVLLADRYFSRIKKIKDNRHGSLQTSPEDIQYIINAFLDGLHGTGAKSNAPDTPRTRPDLE